MVNAEADGHEKRRGSISGWVVLAATAGLYGIAALGEPGTARSALIVFRGLLERVLPPLTLAYLLIVLLELYLPAERIKRFLGTVSGPKGWLAAVGMGVLSIGPIYPWYVLLGKAKAEGMGPAPIAMFLYARSVKPPLIPLLIHYFGPTFTAVLVVYLLLFSVIVGVVVGALCGPRRDHGLR